MKMLADEPIDLVYTWVDGSDEAFRKSLAKTQSEYSGEAELSADAIIPSRFHDLDNLRYSIRSVEQNAPWVNRIFIVTNGQMPRWLKRSDRVRIVTHQEIFLNKEFLPTFNSTAIELQMHRIPELSRFFLYLNDDMFIARPTSPDYFFGSNGRPKIFFAPWGLDPAPKTSLLWYHQLAYLVKLLNERFDAQRNWRQAAHGPTLFDKDALKDICAIWKDEINKTSQKQFRDKEDVLLHPFYTNALAALESESSGENNCRHEIETVNDEELLVIPVGDPGAPWRELLTNSLHAPPRFICLNDNIPAEIADAVDFSEIEKAHKSFLETLFPAPSAHERRLYVLWKKLQNRIRS